jgi:hypothetical protein
MHPQKRRNIGMRYKIIIDGEHQKRQKDIKRNSGDHFNDFPPNMREISPSDFWHWFGSYQPAGTEFRQPIVDRGFWGNLTLLFSNHAMTEGYAFTTHWDPVSGHNGPNDFWPRFFRFGICIHVDTASTIGNCLRKYTCKKCGRSYTIDSSD